MVLGVGGSRAYERAIICTLLAALLLRFCVGLHSYSGKETSPMFGDYEAQRHWMEVTINLPPKEWYHNSFRNNLSYWGLDYPPLSGYQSWLSGKFLFLFEPAAVELVLSHGYESPSSKQLMRLTVLVSDMLCYLPACLACAFALYKLPQQRLMVLAAMALNPALLIIDHGHFQYNCISLGAAAGAVALISRDQLLIGAFLFCASLSHKQMSLYFAPAVFAHLLGCCIQQKGWGTKVSLFAALGTVVLASMALMWAPFLSSVESALAVLGRVFPTQRGLFEDYVANFWCVSSVGIKWKKLFAPQLLLRMCTAITLLALLPAAVVQAKRPTKHGFMLCLSVTSMSFFMFSFQVHEKTVLLPLLPLTMLMADKEHLGVSVIHASMLSMYPLLEKDGLVEAYWGLILVHLGVSFLFSASSQALGPNPNIRRRRRREKQPQLWYSNLETLSSTLFLAGMLGLHILRASVAPPARYPFLWDAAMVSWAWLRLMSTYVQIYKQHLK